MTAAGCDKVGVGQGIDQSGGPPVRTALVTFGRLPGPAILHFKCKCRAPPSVRSAQEWAIELLEPSLDLERFLSSPEVCQRYSTVAPVVEIAGCLSD